ncbi:unnamed protein product [Rotaria magnacalcarata]|uniref:Nuclear receptor domain-containing protein n=2 Tax=Rotaria magnacalcarata TaxID=392030 RepID=A0A816TM84_9BILA|nr:unnamed protein product [Rotaria magnacalcarata]
MANKEGNPSPGAPQSRKRRLRVSQEMYASNPSTDMSTSFNAKNTNDQPRKKSDLSCVVCCGSAHGYNFDAISCESCKAFFRRNALLNTDRLKCRRDGCCEITLETRRRCKSCRLKKCFTVGMRKEWILTEEEKVNKKRRIEENRRLRLTNVDESLLPSNGISKQSMDITEKQDVTLQTVVLDKNPAYPLKTASIGRTSDFFDYVTTAFNDGFQLNPTTSYGWSYPLAKKITALYQILQTKNTTALRLINFFKRLSEFDTLNEIDKVNLVKNNLASIFFFHAALGYDPINDIYHEGIPSNDALLYGDDIRDAHGNNIHIRCILIMRSLSSIVQMDPRIMQLTLVIFLFAIRLSNMINIREPPLTNRQQVFEAQNIYVEQLWIFLEKHFGLTRTIRTFTTLISKCLLIDTLFRDIQQDIHENVDRHYVPPIMRTLIDMS